jgi:hypothetical protein
MRSAMTLAAIAAAAAVLGSAWAGTGSGEDWIPPPEKESLRDALGRARAIGAHAESSSEPLYAGLPASLSARLPEEEGFVPFGTMTETHDIPLGEDWDFQPDRDMEQLLEEEGWARLPEGQTIVRRKDAQGREVWDYPAGTRLLHRILFKSAPEPVLFEMRYIEKRADGKWSMGLFHPSGPPKPVGQTGALALNRDADAHARFDVDLGTATIRVHVQRLRPDSCRHCHWAMGEGGYQYPDMEHAGPCGFVPTNPHLLKEWAEAYRKSRGASPFSAAPAS